MLRKITRIILKFSAWSFLAILVLFGLFLIGIQTFAFQTWLGKRSADYLGSEWGTKVEIKRVELEFFRRANLRQVLVLDKHQDTLFYGDVLAEFSNFNYRGAKLNIDKLVLHNSTAKIVKYKREHDYNFSFISDYFSNSDTATSTAKPWRINYGMLKFNDVNFTYKIENDSASSSSGVNFEDIDIRHLYGLVKRFQLSNDTIKLIAQGLRFKEKSGFNLQELSGNMLIHEHRMHFKNLVLRTPQTNLKTDLQFKTESWDDYSDFITKVQMQAEIQDSSFVCFDDIALFASDLLGLHHTVALAGRVKGTVSDLQLKHFTLHTGKQTAFMGDLHINGLPILENTYLHLRSKTLSTSYSDLTAIPNYPFAAQKMLEVPATLDKLGKVNFKGSFDGFLNDFTTYGVFTTGIGTLYTDLSVQLPKESKNTTYVGKLRTEDFDLGTLLDQSDFNRLNLDLAIDGKGIALADIDAELSGKINSLQYNNYLYNSISLNGSFNDQVFNGLLSSKDPNADFDFNGSMSFKNKLPQMDFISTINRLNLQALHFTTAKDSGVFSSQIMITLSGDNINNLSGSVNFDNTKYKTKTQTYKLSTFDIQAEQSIVDKKIRLNSEYFNTTILGHYKIENLVPAFTVLLHSYFPTLVPSAGKVTFTDDIDVYLRIKKFNVIHDLFLPDLMLSSNTLFEGHFKARENKLNLQLSSPLTNYTNHLLKDLMIIINQSDSMMLVEASGKAVNITDSVSLENFNLQIKGRDTTMAYTIDWDNLRSPKNKGELKGSITTQPNRLLITNNSLILSITDSLWQQEKPATVGIFSNGEISFSPLTIARGNQAISISGIYSKRESDSLTVGINNLVLQQFNGLLKQYSIKLQGRANGLVTMGHVAGNSVFNGFLKLNELSLNDNLIGELVLNAAYHSDKKFVDVNGYTSLGIVDEFGKPFKNISFNGTYELEKKDENIAIDFSARPANLRILNPFLTDIITIEKGFVNGEGKIHGNPDDIRIDGAFKLFNSEIKVDYTNVTYAIKGGGIEIMPDQIRFSDLLMLEKGSKSAAQGTINGNIFHRKFSNWQLDYDISYRNMLVLNTTEKENSAFYGKIYGTGNVGIYGFVNKLHMQIIDTTTKNSKFVLPLDGPAEIDENDFVHFVKHDTTKVPVKKSLSGFDLTMNLHATPDASVQIIIDNKSGDMLNVQGGGDLNLALNTLGKFEMIGDYKIKNGNYLFTLENIINKKFDIESGSSISWSGDPVNAEIDITTNYRQRASVAPLLDDSAYAARTPVDCKLKITDKLFSPNIQFEIEFPNLDATAKSRIANVLSDETELNRQVFSFLLFRTFTTPFIYNKNVQGGVTAGGAAANTGSELLSNRVTEFLNTYVGALSGLKDLELGLNYRPGTGTKNESVDLALSKQFLDNRVTVDGNFGVNQNAQNSNSLIGDVNVDYKLTRDGRFRLKGFNRSNDNTQIATAGGPYTQGVGFFYRVEFNTLEDLYKNFLGKTKKQETSTGK